MKIAVLNRDLDIYNKGTKFGIKSNRIVRNGQYIYAIESSTGEYYFDIIDYGNILKKVCKNEIIEYHFDDDRPAIKRFYTPDGKLKKEKTINDERSKDSYILFIELLNKGYK